jgi:lipoprotein Spr
MAIEHAARARALVGTRFRPQGRQPETGLDCVGLVLSTFGISGDVVRRDYRLRGDYRRELLAELSGRFRRIPASRAQAGDVLVLKVAADQLHLAVMTMSGFVHADARRGRAVESPGPPAWPIVAVYRKRKRG